MGKLALILVICALALIARSLSYIPPDERVKPIRAEREHPTVWVTHPAAGREIPIRQMEAPWHFEGNGR